MDPFWILTLVAAGLLLGAGAASNRRAAKATSRRPVKGAAKKGAAGGGSGASRRSGGASKAAGNGGSHVRSWAAGMAAALWEKRRGYWKFGPGHPETKTGDRAHCAYCMRRFADSDTVRAHIKAKHPDARISPGPSPNPQPSDHRNDVGPAPKQPPKTTPEASGVRPDGTNGGTWMDIVNSTASDAQNATAEPLASLPDFDHRVVLLRRFSAMFATLVEETYNDARHLGISTAVLEPFAEAANTLGVEIPEALLETGKRLRTEYAEVIDHAENGVDLRFFNQRGAA